MDTKPKFHTFLPDEIIVNILSRLPAKTAARCRLVCKLWKDFTFSPSFLDLHLRYAKIYPTILVTTSLTLTERRSRRRLVVKYDIYRSGVECFAIDNWWESEETGLFIHNFPFGIFPNASRALFSHAGFIVLLENERNANTTPLNENNQACFVIVNPVTPREYTRISLPKQLYKSLMIYGVYFHPVLKEYCSLWKLKESGDSERFQYKILTLGSKPSMKTIRNPFNNTAKSGHMKPLLIDNHLYWMLESQQHRYGGWNDVMKFDIINEEFGVIPSPVPSNTRCFHDQTHLLDIDGILSYVLILSGKITIWRLGDHVSNSWIAAVYTFSIENWYEPKALVDVIAARDGKLAILSQRMLYVCNLTDGTVNCLQRCKYSKKDVSFLSHQLNLASLNNCKSTIFIDENGEVVRDTLELEISGSRDIMERSSSSNGLAS